MTSVTASTPPVKVNGPGFLPFVIGTSVQVALLLASFSFTDELAPVLVHGVAGHSLDPWLICRLFGLFAAWAVWVGSLGHCQLTSLQLLLTAPAVVTGWSVVFIGPNQVVTVFFGIIAVCVLCYQLSNERHGVKVLGIPRPALQFAPALIALALPQRSLLSLIAVVSAAAILAHVPNLSPDPSVVDRFWSILPPLLGWVFVFSGRCGPRNVATAVLTTLWGSRLTYNFYVKGGYSEGVEDYRWAIVRTWYTPFQFTIFHGVFVCFFQILLLTSLMAPAAVAVASTVPLTLWDVAVVVAACAFLLGETVADAQMLRFQTTKALVRGSGGGVVEGQKGRTSGTRSVRSRSPVRSAKSARAPSVAVVDGEEAYNALSLSERVEVDAGFCSRGLWAHSRHPNYFCEVMFWWCIAAFAFTSAPANLAAPRLLGAVLLTLLFVAPGASLHLTETISSAKYPRFAEYQGLDVVAVPSSEVFLGVADDVSAVRDACGGPSADSSER